MKTALFLTYNTIGREGTYQNGEVEENGHRAIINQHPRGKTWGVDQSLSLDEGTSQCQSLVHEIYQKALGLSELPEFVVVYVGDSGSEGAIEIASHLPVERVCFVFCDCNLSRKRQMVANRGMHSARIIYCECGGHSTMLQILRRFLQTGEVGLNC